MIQLQMCGFAGDVQVVAKHCSHFSVNASLATGSSKSISANAPVSV